MFHVKHNNHPLAGVSRETEERLTVFVALLLSWNRTINLISKRDEEQVWERHVADSLNLLQYLPSSFDSAIDLGSGGGFPGIVLAIASDRRFTLIEADQRKAAFLREAARVCGAPAIVLGERAERAVLPAAPVITARALAPIKTLLTWATPLLAPGGICLFPKGRTVGAELTQAVQQWRMCVEQWPSPLDPAARVLRLSEISRV